MDDWIKKLKAGDTVIIHGKWSDRLAKIDKITPTGKIKIGDTHYSPDGYSIGNGTRLYVTSLCEATPEAIEALRQKEVIIEATYTLRNKNSLTYEQAVKILEIFGEQTQKGE